MNWFIIITLLTIAGSLVAMLLARRHNRPWASSSMAGAIGSFALGLLLLSFAIPPFWGSSVVQIALITGAVVFFGVEVYLGIRNPIERLPEQDRSGPRPFPYPDRRAGTSGTRSRANRWKCGRNAGSEFHSATAASRCMRRASTSRCRVRHPSSVIR